MPEAPGNRESTEPQELQSALGTKSKKSKRNRNTVSYQQFLSDYNATPIAGLSSRDLEGEGSLAFDRDAPREFRELVIRGPSGRKDISRQSEASSSSQENAVPGPNDKNHDHAADFWGAAQWIKRDRESAGVERPKKDPWELTADGLLSQRPWGAAHLKKRNPESTSVETSRSSSSESMAGLPLSKHQPATPSTTMAASPDLPGEPSPSHTSDSAKTPKTIHDVRLQEAKHEAKERGHIPRHLRESQEFHDRVLNAVKDMSLSPIPRDPAEVHRAINATAPVGMFPSPVTGGPPLHRNYEEDVRGLNMPRSVHIGPGPLDAPPDAPVSRGIAGPPQAPRSRYRSLQEDVRGANMPRSVHIGPGPSNAPSDLFMISPRSGIVRRPSASRPSYRNLEEDIYGLNMPRSGYAAPQPFNAPPGLQGIPPALSVRGYALPSGLVSVLPPPHEPKTPTYHSTSGYPKTPPENTNGHGLGISGLDGTGPAPGPESEPAPEVAPEPEVEPTPAPEPGIASESVNATANLENVEALMQSNANECTPENIRPAPQNLRYGAFQGQQPPQSRNTPLGSGRLQNASKSGSGPSWAFGAPNGVSALPASQPRQAAPGVTSFAQTIGGPPPAASLDLSEFPSLSGTSQSQYQNPSQAIWANQRAFQQTPVQRPQHQQPSVNSQASQQHLPSQQPQDQSHRGNDDVFSTSSLQSALDDHRYGGTGNLGQMPSSRQPQPTSVDEFPPLGRNGTDGNDDRAGTMQNAGFGGFSNTNAFSLPPDQASARNPLPSASSSQANNTRASSVVDRFTSPPNGIGFSASSSGRSPTDSNRQGSVGVQDHDRVSVAPAAANPRQNNMNSVLNNFNDNQFPPQQQASQSQQHDYTSPTSDAGRSVVSSDQTTSQTDGMEEWGLGGFLATVTHENPNVAGLARGQDLNSLGLNLNSPDPLYPHFAGPFAEIGSRPFQPDFKLPECYVVDNVHRVRDKISSFAEETLFWIFYNQPKDLMQELAACELGNRNWRYHKELKMWLTKDTNLPEPIQISPEKEQGSYHFFNPQQWEKVRVPSFELHYHQLAPVYNRPNF